MRITEKITLRIEGEYSKSELRDFLTGKANENLEFIRRETGCAIFLRGVGSGFIENAIGRESDQPMHFLVTYDDETDGGEQVHKYVFHLIETVQTQMKDRYYKNIICRQPIISRCNVKPSENAQKIIKRYSKVSNYKIERKEKDQNEDQHSGKRKYRSPSRKSSDRVKNNDAENVKRKTGFSPSEEFVENIVKSVTKNLLDTLRHNVNLNEETPNYVNSDRSFKPSEFDRANNKSRTAAFDGDKHYRREEKVDFATEAKGQQRGNRQHSSDRSGIVVQRYRVDAHDQRRTPTPPSSHHASKRVKRASSERHKNLHKKSSLSDTRKSRRDSPVPSFLLGVAVPKKQPSPYHRATLKLSSDARAEQPRKSSKIRTDASDSAHRKKSAERKGSVKRNGHSSHSRSSVRKKLSPVDSLKLHERKLRKHRSPDDESAAEVVFDYSNRNASSYSSSDRVNKQSNSAHSRKHAEKHSSATSRKHVDEHMPSASRKRTDETRKHMEDQHSSAATSRKPSSPVFKKKHEFIPVVVGGDYCKRSSPIPVLVHGERKKEKPDAGQRAPKSHQSTSSRNYDNSNGSAHDKKTYNATRQYSDFVGGSSGSGQAIPSGTDSGYQPNRYVRSPAQTQQQHQQQSKGSGLGTANAASYHSYNTGSSTVHGYYQQQQQQTPWKRTNDLGSAPPMPQPEYSPLYNSSSYGVVRNEPHPPGVYGNYYQTSIMTQMPVEEPPVLTASKLFVYH